MPTTVTERFTLSVTPAAVLDRLADRSFVQRRIQANPTLRGALREHTDDGRTIRIRTEATVPLDWMPTRVTGAVSALPTVERNEAWDRGSLSGSTRFVLTGVPARASGSMRLDPATAGSTLTYRIDLTVDMPFVGGLVERAVAAQIRRSLAAEAAVYGER